jgi:hypothetical protein
MILELFYYVGLWQTIDITACMDTLIIEHLSLQIWIPDIALLDITYRIVKNVFA